MTDYEQLTLIISGISAVIAIISLNKANKASQSTLNKADIQNMIAMGNLELSIGERISNSRDKVGDVTLILTPLLAKKQSSGLSAEEELILTAQSKVLDASVENNLNAYEDACSKFLDERVDQIRFKKAYNVEIRQLVEAPSLQRYFNPLTSRYKAILKVYQRWNNLEN